MINELINNIYFYTVCIAVHSAIKYLFLITIRQMYMYVDIYKNTRM